MKNVNQTIVETFREVAEYLETGRSGRRPRLLLTGMGSEHGEENSMQAAVMAARVGLDVSYIGTLEGEGVTTVPVADEEAGHRKMVELLESGAADAAVTMHFPFPIGVSTVGRVVTPARGKSMFLATTTGTSSANRLEGMILNTIYGIITAKACGIQEPTVGILNVDGARACETALRQLQQAGYPIRFAESVRADGGAVMRGNDVLQGTPDVMVCDSLTGNVLIKMLSSFTTGGSFESTGYGYGPGIGRDYDKLVLIISRASGAPLIANALSFADELVRDCQGGVCAGRQGRAGGAPAPEAGGFRSGGSQGRGEGSRQGALHRRHPRHRGHGHRGRRAGAVGQGYLCRVRYGLHRPAGAGQRCQRGKGQDPAAGGRLHRLRL